MREFFSIFFWIWWAACIIFFFIVVTLLYLFTFFFDRYNRIPNRILKGLAWSMMRLIPMWSLEIRGADPRKIDKPTIAVANHQSFMDIPLLYLLPWTMKWVSKKAMFKIPIFGWIIYMTGHLGIDRKSSRSVKELDKLVEPVKKGIPAMIFPEGTRSLTGELRDFKNGAFKLARQYNFQILPIVLEGSHKAMPPGDWRFRFGQKFRISVLDPVKPTDFNTTTELKAHVHAEIDRELSAIRNE